MHLVLFLLCGVKMSGFGLLGRERAAEEEPLEDLEISDARLLVNASDVEEEMSFAFVLDESLTP
jgi:hypothetical protein